MPDSDKRSTMRKDFKQLLNKGFVILDGATGSNLQRAGMKSGECPEQWIVEHPDIFIELQKKYIEAGSDVLYTPTFTCNRIKLEEYGLADRQAELTRKLVGLTKEAIRESNTERNIYIAGDISMTGQQLEPVGSLPFEALVDIYKEQVSLLAKEGVDVFAIETMMSLQECRAALLAVKKMAEYASVPIVVKPNAGLPTLVDGVTCYDMKAKEFADSMTELIQAGATVLGGCCGTTPEHIRKLSEAVSGCPVPKREKKSIRVLTTERNITPISLDGNFMIVGERINPTGKKALQEELKAGSLDMVTDMAEEQAACGAKVLDVNMGMNGIDEKEMMKKVVDELTMTVDLPLSIDSSYVEVVESALRIYPGRALINSISLEKDKFEKLIPVAKKYGAMFILLPLSGEGLPKNIEEKKKIIHTILAEAKRQGLSEEDVIVDGLVATIGADKRAALEVMETIRYCKNELHVATICGLSNISFGLPERAFVNTAFLTLAIGEGLTMAIANPSQTLLTNAALATDLLLNKQEADIRYINGVSPATLTQAQPKQGEGKAGTEAEGHPLYMAVVKGKSGHVLELVEKELAQGAKPAELIDTHMIPAINYVGELFEQKKYFLPQLIASAETMEKAITRLEPLLEAERGNEKLDTVIMATVKGDIHDIGKNLVVLMLKNYGYDVIDLGKDVEAQDILDEAKRTKAAVIGLSALMTTTMMEMKQVIDMAKEQGVESKIIVGGAVVTESFAEEIGADGYSSDAREAVKLVNRLLHNERNQ